MNAQHPSADSLADLVDRFGIAIREERPDDAQQALAELAELDAGVASRPVYTTMLAIARGDAVGALRALQTGGEAVDELRAICLRAIGDPTWEGLAESIARESDDPSTRAAMYSLLGREVSAG
jgi:type III secretion protein HrpB1